MKITTSGTLRRVDLAPAVDLLPALRDEWAGLKFDHDGWLINPLTQERVDTVRLVGGRHRRPGARYRIATPEVDLPEDQRAEFDAELEALAHSGADQAEWEDHFVRRQAASVPTGTDEHVLTFTLRGDDMRSLGGTLTDDSGHWSVDVDVHHRRLPAIDLRGAVDIDALLLATGTPGCLARFLGGRGEGTATVDLATIEGDGRSVDAEGHAGRFHGSVQMHTRTSPTEWQLDGTGTLRARGLARPIQWIVGRRLRRRIEASLTSWWADAEPRLRSLRAEMDQLRSAIEHEGGEAAFVRRALWDDTFDPDAPPPPRTPNSS